MAAVDGEAQQGAQQVVRPGGREAKLFNDHLFCRLRASAQVPDAFVDDWSLDKMGPGGGKGGTLMALVGALYIVKELSDGDHKTMLLVAESYADHVQGAETMLCAIFLHFEDVATRRRFFVMENALGNGPFLAVYDLKGCADDKTIEKDGVQIKPVHKRIWNTSLWLGKRLWSDGRHRYYAGKLEARGIEMAMTAEQRSSFVQTLRRDTTWLADNALMDYSLLVAMEQAAAGQAGDPPARGPLVHRGADGGDVALRVRIIDFLQKWTTGKKVARYIKAMERNKATMPPRFYADRFFRHFERCTAVLKIVVGDTSMGSPAGTSAAAEESPRRAKMGRNKIAL